MGKSKKRKSNLDVFEADQGDPKAVKDLTNKKRYEGTDVYEYEMPEEFEDEEIESDEAFNAADRVRYAHIFDKRDKGSSDPGGVIVEVRDACNC
jgi:U3 small nucleolar RNA-associated protein 14